MKYAARVSFCVFVEANSPEEAEELILSDVVDFSGLETDGNITVGDAVEVED
jgi:hypothetical protein